MVNEILKTDIPDDWSVITLGNYAQIFRGGSPRPIQAFLTTSDKGVNWIKIGDVGEEDKFIKSTEEKSYQREFHVLEWYSEVILFSLIR